MHYKLWGENVDICIPEKLFPTQEEISKMDEMFCNPSHFFHERSDGQKIHYFKVSPDKDVTPKGVCVFQHGIRAHGLMGYQKLDQSYCGKSFLARSLREAGFYVYFPDLFSHGFSEGSPRFYIPNGDWETNNLNDLESIANIAARSHKDLPLFLMGESYGACLAIHLARRWQDDNETTKPKNFIGMALLAPAVIGDLPPAPIVFFLRNILAPLAPRWTPFFMPNPVSADRVWKDEEVCAYFTTGRQKEMGLQGSGGKFSLGTAVGLLRATEELREKSIPGLTVPFCVIHGTSDMGTLPGGSEFLVKHCSTTNYVFRKVEGAYHDLLSEPTKKESMNFVIEWILSQLPQEK